MRSLVPLLLLLAACATTGPRAAVGLPLAGPVTADASGNVFLATPDNIVRYDPKAHEMEGLLFDPVRMTALAAVPHGPLIVLLGRRLEAVAPGRRILLVELPGEGLLLAARRDAAYVAVARGEDTDVLRYRFAERTLDPIFRSAARPQALAAVPGGCLVAMGSGVHKVFDPHDGEVERRLLFATSGPVTGLAADEGSETICFSDRDGSYAWRHGHVWPLFPAGGALAVGSGRVYIADAEHGQLLDLPVPKEPAFEEVLEPERRPRAYRTEPRLVEQAATWQAGGALALAFKVENPLGAWLDLVEIDVNVRAPDDSSILVTKLAVPLFVAPYGSVGGRVDVPASALRGQQVKDVIVSLSRAREASVEPTAIALAWKDTCWVDGRLLATIEIRNQGGAPVRVEALAFGHVDAFGGLLAQPSLRSCDLRLAPGGTSVLEVALVSVAEHEALEAQHKGHRIEVACARLEPSE